MSAIFLVTALLVIPAGFLIVLGDETDPREEAQRIIRKNAKKSGDRKQLRSRLEELGRGTEREYVDFRIRQYGFCASSLASFRRSSASSCDISSRSIRISTIVFIIFISKKVKGQLLTC